MKIVIIVVAILGLIAGLVALGGLVTWAVWNALVPDLFDGPTIKFWQAILVNVGLGIIGSSFRRSTK